MKTQSPIILCLFETYKDDWPAKAAKWSDHDKYLLNGDFKLVLSEQPKKVNYFASNLLGNLEKQNIVTFQDI